MAGPQRPAPLVVDAIEWLQREPYKFDFVQAVRLLECYHRDKPRLGETTRASEEAIRLAQEPSLAFAPATLADFQHLPAGLQRLTVHFLGLLGPNGPLPLHLTEHARDRSRNAGDETFRRFLDIFHHRALSLFYRASAAGRAVISLDRPAEDRFGLCVGALIGLGHGGLRDRDGLSDWAKQSYACHLVRHARNAEGLRDMLADLLQLPVEVEEFVGHWIELPPEGQLRLGSDGELGVLGESFTIGSRVWDCQCKFRIVVGPVPLDDFARFLPDGESLPRLRAAVRNYLGDELDWELRLILKKEETPPLVLGQTGHVGHTMWLTSRPMPRDPGDFTWNASASAARHARRRAAVAAT